MGRTSSTKRARWLVAALVVVVLAACGSSGSTAKDSSAGDEIVLVVAGSSPASSADLELSAEIVQARLRALGVDDAEVAVRGQKLVATGTDIPDTAPDLLGRGMLELRPVLAIITPMSTDEKGGEVLPNNPADDVNVKYSVGPAALTGAAVDSAKAQYLSNAERWVVTVQLTAEGAAAFNELAATQFAKSPPENAIAIVLDGVVQSAPQVQTPRFEGGVIQISGSYTEAEVRALAAVLEAGALPVQFELAP